VLAAPLPPLFEALAARGLRIGILTNDGEAPTRRHLAAWGVLDRVDMVIGADSGWGPKPDPAGALAFCRALSLPPAAVALVGDGMTDMDAARGAGMRAVGVLTGALGEAALAPHAEAVLPDVAALPAWIDAAEARSIRDVHPTFTPDGA
jgi:phosphoglycolate phosphatase